MRWSVIHVGGARSISPASRRAMASAGRIHVWSWISPPSIVITGVTAGHGARKNHVANRFGEIGGAVQCENGTRSASSSTRPASSAASRTAARRAAVASSCGASAR